MITPVAARPHLRQHELRQVQRREHVHAEDALHLLPGQRIERGHRARPELRGVVDQHIDAPEAIEPGLDQPLRLLRDVGRQR